MGTPAQVAAQVARVEGESVEFELNGVRLVPLSQLHDERYTIYWPLVPDLAALEERLARFTLQKQREEELAARTLDFVQPGEQQSEVDHGFQGEQTASGYNNERGWRRAVDGGWFSYRMNVECANDEPLQLICTYWSGDTPAREFDIFVDDVLLVTAQSGGHSSGELVDVAYPIPAGVVQGKSVVRVKWQSRSGSVAGIYGCRITREETP